MNSPVICAVFTPQAPPLCADFNQQVWQQAKTHSLNCNWQGEAAPAELATTVLLLWTAEELWLGFTCQYSELDVDEQFDLSQERPALWERDVCEVFIQSPLEPTPQSYKEFEAAPTGQWLDLAIHIPRAEVDWHWNSGMRTISAIDPNRQEWRAVLAIPLRAFGLTPNISDQWRANLFRISRWQGQRHYLAYSATLTPLPDFHVPTRFATLLFTA